MQPSPVTAFIALGSNMGDRADYINRAIEMLAASEGVEVVRVSSLREYPAVGGPPGSPAFLNAAAELRTTLSPQAILQNLLNIERALGRVRREKWGPRTIDLDILLFADLTSHERSLTLPHPLMHERLFVLEPLAEIAPHVRHPTLDRSIRELRDVIAAKG